MLRKKSGKQSRSEKSRKHTGINPMKRLKTFAVKTLKNQKEYKPAPELVATGTKSELLHPLQCCPQQKILMTFFTIIGGGASTFLC